MLRITLVLFLLWLPVIVFTGEGLDNFFFWRHQLIMLTGILSLGYMSLAVLLASRFHWVESLIKGLDKGYALHKKLGIGATVALIAHWLTVNSAKWLIEAELIARPNRHRPQIEGINWHGIAEGVGDISFKVFLIFAIISLVQAISYKKFRFTHKIGGILVIAGVFHTALLLDWKIQALPMNIAIAVLSVIGVWCSWLSLSGKIGKQNKATGIVSNVEQYSPQAGQNMAVRFGIKLDSTINYKEGQFAYLDFHDGEAPHPFSILNYDAQNKQIEFAVKDLGDYTHKLVNNLKTEQPVTVEGGYGYFQIPNAKQQVWVGAGIGIVPFISRLYWLKHKANKQQTKFEKIHLFYCVNSHKEAFFSKEIANILSQLEFIELHIMDAEKDELLDSEQIMQKMDGTTFDISFCGPEAFGETLKSNLALAGVPESRFHSELFRMR